MLPGVRQSITDGNLGLVQPAPDKLLVIGPCSSGVVNTIVSAAQPSALSTALGVGRAVTVGGHILDVAGGTVDVMKCAASVAASNGSVTASGSGPLVSVGGSGTEAYDAIIRIVNSGQLGVGRFDFSLDGGETYGSVRTIPSAGTFLMPSSGLTLTFAPLSAVVRTGGTTGPVVTPSGAAPTGDNDFIIEITTGGALGAGVFKWSKDGGLTYTTGVSLAASVVLTGTGVTAGFAAGTYVLGEKYSWSSGYNATETYSFTATPATFNSADLDGVLIALRALNTRWKAVVFAGRPANAAAAAVLAATIGGQMTVLAAQARDTKALIDCGGDPAASISAVQTAFDAVGDFRLAPFYGDCRIRIANPIEGFRNPWLPTQIRAAGSVAIMSRGSNIGWVGLGAAEGPGRPRGGRLSKVSAIRFDEGKAGEQLHDHRINATRTFDGDQPGKFYFTNGLLLSPLGSDFRYLHWGLAFDLLCQTVNDAMKPYVNASLAVLTDGTGALDPVVAEQIDVAVNAAIRTAVLDPITEQGKGYFSAAQFACDRTYNTLVNRKLVGSFRAVPLANTEQVELTGGMATDLVAAAAEAA
jgi:hypothetical protein